MQAIDAKNESARENLITICICTKDRPATLKRCLESIANGHSQPDAVLVSDDSANLDASLAICREYPYVTLVKGPQRGLCANRNTVIRHAAQGWVSLIDDDGIVDAGFVEQLRAILPQLGSKTLVTGDVLEYGGRTTPNNPSFLGYFTDPPRGVFKNINLNCNCLPITAFSEAHFDEAVIYGYEDMDLCSNLLSKGYSIHHVPSLVNSHVPPVRTKVQDAERHRLTQQARFQTSMKRYLLWEKAYLKAALYLFIAPLHRVAHSLKKGDYEDIPRSFSDIWLALTQALGGREKAS